MPFSSHWNSDKRRTIPDKRVTQPSTPDQDLEKPLIGLVGERAPPAGGMAAQAESLATFFESNGYRVANRPTNLLAPKSILGRLRGIRALTNQWLFLASLLRCPSQISAWHILSNSYLSFFLFTAPVVILGRLSKKPVVIHFHGGAARPFFNYWFWLVGPIFRSASRIVVPSAYLAEIFAEQNLETVIIPNIATLPLYQFHERTPIAPRLLYTRHLRPCYNPECALRAFGEIVKKWPNAEFRIAGDGSEMERMQNLASEMNIQDRVTFLGHLPNDQLVTHYEWANLFLNSSVVDNQPVSILEAFASGLPVVTTNAGGIPYMVENRKTGMVVGMSHLELAQAALELIEDEKLSRSIAKRALEELQNYRWEAVYPKWAKLYSLLTGRQENTD